MGKRKTTTVGQLESDALAKSTQFRFQEQCFLTFNRDLIYQQMINQNVPNKIVTHIEPGTKHTRDGSGKWIKGAKGKGIVVTHQPSSVRSLLQNEHVVSLLSKEPDALVSKLNKLDGAHMFFKLDASVLSQLKPIVELYKIYPNKKTKKDADASDINPGQPVVVRMPIGEQIRKDREDYDSNPYEPWIREHSALEEIFKPHGILGNAMLRDLSFSFQGKNIAELNTVEEVQFTMNFSSTELFFHTFETRANLGDGKTEVLNWSYQDLISYSSLHQVKKAGQSAPITLDENNKIEAACANDYRDMIEDDSEVAVTAADRHFEIRLVVRYDPDDIDWKQLTALAGNDRHIHNFTIAEKESIKNFLRNSGIVMRLQLTQHTIHYGADSSGADPNLEITFEYKAFLEGTLSGSDLDLLPSSIMEKDLTKLLSNLATARRLLKVVEDENLTLDQIFTPGTTDASNEDHTDMATKYRDLRVELLQTLGYTTPGGGGKDRVSRLLEWLIFLPREKKGNGSVQWSTVKPTKKELAKSVKKKRSYARKSARNQQKMRARKPWELEVQGGLHEPTKDKPNAGHENAKLVFKELIDHIKSTINGMKRLNVVSRYGHLFDMMMKTNRVYMIDARPEQLGLDRGSKSNKFKPGSSSKGYKFKTEENMADQRKGWGDTGTAASDRALAEWRAHKVHVVGHSVGVRGNKGGKKLIEEFSKKVPITVLKNPDGENLQREMNMLFGEDWYGRKNRPRMRSRGLLGIPKFKRYPGRIHVYFTTLGDIIDSAITLATIDKKVHGLYKKRIGVLLGPVVDDVLKPGKRNNKLSSLADIPISLRAVMGFWTKKVVTRQRSSYALGDFIRDLVTDLILPALGSRCIDDVGQGNHVLGISSFSSETKTFGHGADKRPPFYPNLTGRTGDHTPQTKLYPPDGASRVLVEPNHYVEHLSHRALPWFAGRGAANLTKISPGTPLEDQYKYMVIYINNISSKGRRANNEQKNIDDGIYYLHLGLLPSVVSGGTFSLENMAHVREARAMGQLTSTGGMALRDVYHFTCKMYGNNIFKPGMLVFVDPTRDGAFDFRKWQRLGIGGFYRIVSVSHNVLHSNNVIHETNIRAMWDSFGAGQGVCTKREE